MPHVLPEIPPYGEPASPEMRKNKKEKERRRVKGENGGKDRTRDGVEWLTV
jgi:hypothetical protein